MRKDMTVMPLNLEVPFERARRRSLEMGDYLSGIDKTHPQRGLLLVAAGCVADAQYRLRLVAHPDNPDPAATVNSAEVQLEHASRILEMVSRIDLARATELCAAA